MIQSLFFYERDNGKIYTHDDDVSRMTFTIFLLRMFAISRVRITQALM